jgi:outer membrane protein TolC
MFTDPKLQSLIETGLERNADLNVARLRVEAAEAVLMTARRKHANLGIRSESGYPYETGTHIGLSPDL